jgi:hypothetical protein
MARPWEGALVDWTDTLIRLKFALGSRSTRSVQD